MDITINVNADTLSIISAVIALLSMIIAWRQAHIARESLKMEKSIFGDRKPNFTFDSIVDCYAINDQTDDRVHLRFLILLTNRSDRSMAIHEIRLKVRGEVLEYLVQPSLIEGFGCSGDNIEGNQSMQKWVQFDLPRQQYTDLEILDYTVEVKDSHGNSQQKSAIYLREEVHNHEKNVEA